jgi:transposase
MEYRPRGASPICRQKNADLRRRQHLIALARDGSAAHRLARRPDALLLLDRGWSCERVAAAFFVDDDTIRRWHGLFIEDGFDGLARFEFGGSACQMNDEQLEKLKAWVAAALPRSTRQIGAWIEKEFGLVYAGRSGLIALLNRLGLEYHKPEIIPRKLDEEKQRAFIAAYEKLLNSLGADEAVLFADRASDPRRAARRPNSTSSRLNKPAGVSASIFMARLIWRPAKPG